MRQPIGAARAEREGTDWGGWVTCHIMIARLAGAGFACGGCCACTQPLQRGATCVDAGRRPRRRASRAAPLVALLGCVVVACLLRGVSADAAKAVELNGEALEHAYKNDLQQALRLFKKALREDSSNAEVMNNLGVTELRLGLLKDAREHFEGALELQPSHREAQMNLVDLEQYEKKDGAASAVPAAPVPDTDINEELQELIDAGKVHERRALPRVTLDELYNDPKAQPFRIGRAPFVLTGAFEGSWATAQDKWKLEYFKDKFGKRHVDYYPHNMADEKVRPYIIPMETVVNEMQSPSGTYRTDPEHPGTYSQWNVDTQVWGELEDEFGFLPEQFTADDNWLYGCLADVDMIDTFLMSTHWRMLLIGTQGAGMFNHKDTLRTGSYQVQLLGAKRWHLCGPSQDKYMYKAGDLDLLSETPDYETFPRARNASCYDDVVRAGEFVFYPRDWWHQTYNVEDMNLAITGTLSDANNFDSVQREIARDCKKKNPNIIPINPRMCKRLQKCYEWWHDAWMGDFVSREESARRQRCRRSDYPPVKKRK